MCYSLSLPYVESLESLGGLQLPLPRADGLRVRSNSSQASPGLTPNALVSPNSAKKNTSPRSRKGSGMDHAGTPLRATAMSLGGNFFGAPFPGSNGAKRRSSLSKPSANGGGRGKGRGRRGGEMGYMGYSGAEDGFEALDSPMSVDDTHQQQVNGLNGEGLEEVRKLVCTFTYIHTYIHTHTHIHYVFKVMHVRVCVCAALCTYYTNWCNGIWLCFRIRIVGTRECVIINVLCTFVLAFSLQASWWD